VETSGKTDRATRRRRIARNKMIDTLIGRGETALNNGAMKVTIADYIRLAVKEIESEPQIHNLPKWFDDLDSPEAKAYSSSQRQKRM
jgi:hypothetical protein